MDRVYRLLNLVSFACYPLLFVYVRNSGFLQEGGLLLPLLFFTVLALVSYGVIAWFSKKKSSSTYITLLLLLYVQLYGHCYYGLMDGFEIPYESFKHRYFILIYSGFFGLIMYFLWVKNDVSKTLVKVTAILGLLLCSQFALPMYYELSKQREVKNEHPLPPKQTGLPDVYYIVADSYPNEGNLADFYDYDNNSFINELGALGFQVQDRARSNYPYTYFSLASSLNMEYINYFEDSLKLDQYKDDFPFSKIHKNTVAEYFKTKGYQYVLYKSAYAQMNNELNADVYVDNSLTINQFHRAILELSVFSILNMHVLYDSKVYHLCTKAFENLTESNETTGSKFVFFHCLPPHPPLVFNGDGSYNANQKHVKNRYREKQAYCNQVDFVNNAILSAVQSIIKKSKRKPIIIIQGDHGTCSQEEYEDELKWNHIPSKSLLKERYGILNAVYSPGNYKVTFDREHTPVNTFKKVFNVLFNAGMALDSNLYYFSKYRAPYDFQSFQLDNEEVQWGEGSRR